MEAWVGLGSALGSLAFLYPMVQMYFPRQLQSYLTAYSSRLFSYFYPYIQLTIPEYSGERMARSDAYANVESYLAASPSVLRRASKLKADTSPNSKKLLITVGEHEEVVDELGGAVKVWWLSSKEQPSSQTIMWSSEEEGRRYYRLTFHRQHQEYVYKSYLPRVQEEGSAAAVKNRQRRLFTNNPSNNWYGRRYGYRRSVWSHVAFEHPSTFDTLAMDPIKKQEIVDDLTQFRDGKEYYAEVGKAWKRGYLLHGPPGTGKSSMIAAIANFLDYDVYDLELTAVKNNTELRKLFIETTGKSIIVVEDIDCSLDLTAERKKKEKKDDEANKNAPPGTDNKDESSKMTLSGLLNFIDGLWSACGGERIIVFTTNHLEKLDKALIRRGRMDKHIEMSYCGFETFKALAKNYLRVGNHRRFDDVRQLLEEVRMTPADVAENLMPKSAGEGADMCLKRLVEELRKAKEEATAIAAAAKAAAAEAGSKDGAVESG